MRPSIALLALLLAAAAPASAQPLPAAPERTETIVLGRGQLPLRDVLSWAKAHHPSLMAARARFQQAEARVKQALASNVPSVFIQVDRTHTWLEDGGIPNGTSLGAQPISTLMTPTMNLQYQLYDGGRRNATVDKAEQDLLTYDYGWRTQWRNLALNIQLQYLQVVLYLALLDVQEDNVRMAEDNLQYAQGLVRGGRKSQIDALQAEADLSGARASYNQALGNLNNAWALLEAQVGAPLDVYSRVDPLLDQQAALPGEAEMIDLAFAQRSDLLTYGNQIAVFQKQIAINQTNLSPTLASRVKYGALGKDYPLFQQFEAGLAFSVPLNQSNVTKSANLEVLGAIQEASDNAEALRLNIVGALRGNSVKRKEADVRVEITRRQVEEAREAYLLAERRYRTGISQYIELSNARATYNNARSSHEQARYDRKAAEFQLLNAMEQVP